MPIYMRYTRGNGLRVRGGVTAKGYEGWIELESAQLEQTRPSGHGASKEGTARSPLSLLITKGQDCASNDLYGETLRGSSARVQIDFVKAEKGKLVAYMTLELEAVVITSYSTNGAGAAGAKAPMESLVLNFNQVVYSLHGAPAPVAPDRNMWDMWGNSRGG